MNNATATAAIEQIAKDALGLETLGERRSDQLDFHDLSVWQLRGALEAAYKAGQQAGGSAKTRAK